MSDTATKNCSTRNDIDFYNLNMNTFKTRFFQQFQRNAALFAIGCTVLGGNTANAQGLPSTKKLLGQWVQEAKQQDAKYELSPAAGKVFYSQAFSHNPDMPSCTSCHTADPKAQGKHAITGKRIAPFSPLVNEERFADPDKTQKWFKRNCNDVIGRECTSAEKANLLGFLFFGVKQ